jgi:hypothetical protein
MPRFRFPLSKHLQKHTSDLGSASDEVFSNSIYIVETFWRFWLWQLRFAASTSPLVNADRSYLIAENY